MQDSSSSAVLEAIYLSPGHDFKGRFGQDRLDHGVQVVDAVECVAGAGLRGDRYFNYRPDYKGQATFFDAAVGEAVLAECGAAEDSLMAFRRNFITRGLPLRSLIGCSFVFGGVTFEGVEECAPCFWMDAAIGPGAEARLKGCGGLRVRILAGGFLNVGTHAWKLLS